VSTTRITAAHEAWQAPGGDEQWSDSFYFGGGDGAGLAFYARIGRRPNEGVTEGALGVWLPGQGFLLSFARVQPAAAVAAGPLSFECLLPIGIAGTACGIDTFSTRRETACSRQSAC